MAAPAHQVPRPSPMATFEVSASARLQVARLTPTERKRLTSLLSASTPEGSDTKRTEQGRFVSRLSASKRVLWETSGGKPMVLSIADRSYGSK